jgi:hypothetical protein
MGMAAAGANIGEIRDAAIPGAGASWTLNGLLAKLKSQLVSNAQLP